VLWCLAGLVAHSSFVGVTGDLRRDLFRHLTGHAPGYFAQRMPGTLASRIAATSNAVFAVENMFVWNVLPPCAATVVAISLVGTVSASMAIVLTPLLYWSSDHPVEPECNRTVPLLVLARDRSRGLV
jgi:ATP-binding cassette, subfamily B, bacterial